MGREHVSEACFLCESPSAYYEFDGDKRRHYRCTGVMCGEYVVTDAARDRLNVSHAASWRKQAPRSQERSRTNPRSLEIWVNPSTRMLETHLVERSRMAQSGEVKT